MKARKITVHERVLYFCTHFAAYILPERCDDERRVGGGKISARVREGKRSRLAESDVLEDLNDVVAQRRVCLGCPGVCERSARDKKSGRLS